MTKETRIISNLAAAMLLSAQVVKCPKRSSPAAGKLE